MNKRIQFAAFTAIGALALTGCTTLSAGTSDDVGTNKVDPSTAVVTNIDKSQSLEAGERVKVTATSPWVIESIVVGSSAGDVDATIAAPTQWSSAPLEPLQSTTYQVKMRNATTGEVAEVDRKVVSGAPTKTFTADFTPEMAKKSEPQSFGVGIVPKVTFSKEVPVANRKALTDRITVTAAPTPVAGSWRWVDSTTAAFRPTTKFWPGNSTITMAADLENARIAGGKSSSDAWGSGTVTSSFKTARAMIITLNSGPKSGYATVDGKKVKKFPISLGKSDFLTRSGIKTITDIIRVQRMTNVGVTNTEVYDIQVPFAMRITDTGEFLHGAPWNGNIGYANTSHGCSNLTYNDAQWFFSRVKYGDPVITTGTGRPMESWNGPGAMWNIPYAKWASVKT